MVISSTNYNLSHIPSFKISSSHVKTGTYFVILFNPVYINISIKYFNISKSVFLNYEVYAFFHTKSLKSSIDCTIKPHLNSD